MSGLRGIHEAHGGRYVEHGGRSIVADYGRPERAHLAVRNGVGVSERPYDVVIVTGEDRVDFVDNVVSNAVPASPGAGVYALLLDPQGRIRIDLSVYTATDRLLLFLPPGRGPDIVAEWRDRVFIQDVSLEDATEDYAVLAVTGPRATEKLASVMSTAVPEDPFAFVQSEIADAGVTVIPTDGAAGEESYELVCATYDAEVVMDALLTRGYNAVPFGQRTWETLTLEAGTPLLDPDLEGELPNVVGIRAALDFEKGCFVGQEVVSRIENRGRPNEQLVGLRAPTVPDRDAELVVDGAVAGRVSRAERSPSLEEPIGFAFVAADLGRERVILDGEEAMIEDLPFVTGSMPSARCPRYPD